MQFKDIRQGNTLYILDRKELKIIEGRVTSAQPPRANIGLGQTSLAPNFTSTSIVIDINIEVDGKMIPLTVPETASIISTPSQYSQDLLISVDKEGLAAEVESMRDTAKKILASVDQQRKIVEKSDDLLTELSPSYKEKKETDKRFSNLESSVSTLAESMTKMAGMVESLVKELKN